MKLNKETLKRIIKEELDALVNEITTRPDPGSISDDHLNRVHGVIDDGDGRYAQQFIDAFGGDPEYVDKLRAADSLPLEIQLDQIGDEYKKAVRGLQYSRSAADEDRYNSMAQSHERAASEILDSLAQKQHPNNPKLQKQYKDQGFQNWVKKNHPSHINR